VVTASLMSSWRAGMSAGRTFRVGASTSAEASLLAVHARRG
jgi:hypothetical protein